MNIGVVSSILEKNNLSNKNLATSLGKLSSGLNINKASDNASSLTISDNLRTQGSGIKQGIDNANSAVAMMNIADNSMSELSNIFDIIKEKTIQMNTDTIAERERAIIKTEILKLIEQYDKIVCQTNYNGIPLLNGCETPFSFQVGSRVNDIINVNIDSISSEKMGNDSFKLSNFIAGFSSESKSPTTIGDSDFGGLVLNNSLNNRVFYNSNPSGNFMIEIPAGTKNLTIHLDDHGMNDTIQIFTKDGTHVAGTPEGHSSWDSFTTPKDIISLNSNKFNQDASYKDDLSRHILHSVKDSLGDNNVTWVNKNGESQTYELSLNDEMIVIPNVVESLLIFINGNGSYDVGGEWLEGHSHSFSNKSDSICSCEPSHLVRNDTNPNLKIQAEILMGLIDLSLSQLNEQRSNVAAGTNQLESSVRNNIVNYTNIKNAQSIIRDVDYAKETTKFSKLNIISKAGSFALSQVNQFSQQKIASLLK